MEFSTKMSLLSVVILGILLLVSFTEGKDHLVGGKPDAWKVDSSDSDSLNKWAQKSRFNIGDNLVWKYDSKKDSVVEVTREAYLTCNTTNPIAEHKNDETKVVLDKAGPHYFISGNKDNCDKGEKLIAVVISPRTKPSSGGAATAPPALSPSPTSGEDTPAAAAPAVAPTTGAAVVVKSGVMVFLAVVVGMLFM